MNDSVSETVSQSPQSASDPDIVFAGIANRRSMGLSRLKPNMVDRDLIERMLEAANWAPSHGETEPWRFTVFSGDGRESLADLFEAAHREEHAGSIAPPPSDSARKRAFAAPVWISVGMTPGIADDGNFAMPEHEEIMAVACAMNNLHIMACSLGLAGMMHSKGLSISPTVAAGLGLEPPSRLLGFFMCGWPSTEMLTGERRPLSEKVRWIDGSHADS